MLPCKQMNCGWYLVCLDWDQTQRSRGCFPKEVTPMSDTASAPFTPSSAVFGRLIAVIDRLLMSGARIAARNGDLPYFGL
jgi:hypothetical protein